MWPPDSIEGIYQKAHSAICADPAPKVKAIKTVTKTRWTAAKIGLEAGKAKVAAAKEAFVAQIEDQNVWFVISPLMQTFASE